MIDKKLLEDAGYFDESLEVCEDFDLWLRVLRSYELGLVEEILKKLTILLKGAVKHQNIELINFCKKIKDGLTF